MTGVLLADSEIGLRCRQATPCTGSESRLVMDVHTLITGNAYKQHTPGYQLSLLHLLPLRKSVRCPLLQAAHLFR
jgi:hypothetical protein